MSPGFRFHIVTICAIFLALGVGIVIGTSFVQSAVVASQTHAVAQLRDQFNKEIVTSRDANRRYAEFVESFGRLNDGKLSGVKVAMIQTGDYPEAIKRAREALEKAGATITSSTIIDSDFPVRAEANLSTIIANLKTQHPDLPTDMQSLLKVIAATIAKGGGDSDFGAFESTQMIKHEGDYSVTPDYILLVGGASMDNGSRVDKIDLPLIAQFKNLNASVLEVEPMLAEVSYITSLKSTEVTTIDNVDTDMGRVSLVLAIKGERGHYGVKSTASNGVLPIPKASNGFSSNPRL